MVAEHALNKGATPCSAGCTHVEVSEAGSRYVAVASRTEGNTGSYRLTVTLERAHEGVDGGVDLALDVSDDVDTRGFLRMLTPEEFPGFNPAWKPGVRRHPAARRRLVPDRPASGTRPPVPVARQRHRPEAEAEGLRRDGHRLRALGGAPSTPWRAPRAPTTSTSSDPVMHHRIPPFTSPRPPTRTAWQQRRSGASYSTADKPSWTGSATALPTRTRSSSGSTASGRPLSADGSNPDGITLEYLNEGFGAKITGLPTDDDYAGYEFRITRVVDGAPTNDHREVSVVVIPDTPGDLRGGWEYIRYRDAATFEWNTVSGNNLFYEVQIKDLQDEKWVDLGLDPPTGVVYRLAGKNRHQNSSRYRRAMLTQRSGGATGEPTTFIPGCGPPLSVDPRHGRELSKSCSRKSDCLELKA